MSNSSQNNSKTSHIRLTLPRKKSVDRERTSESTSTSSRSAPTERTALLTNPIPLVIANNNNNNNTAGPNSSARQHHIDVINNYNLSDNVKRHIGERVAQARTDDAVWCTVFAFTIVGEQCRSVLNTEAFEADTTNVLAPQGHVITLDQLCVETRRFAKTYKEVIMIVRHLRQTEPQLRLILEKRALKQHNSAGDWLARWRAPLLTGDYYTIIADFAQCVIYSPCELQEV